MLLPRLLAALLAPAGVVAAHAVAYTVAHGWEHERQTLLSGHGPFAVLIAVALPLSLVALIVIVAGDRRVTGLRWRQFVAVQLPLLVGVEVIERATGFVPLVELLHDPAAWAAVTLQLVVASGTLAILRAGSRLALRSFGGRWGAVSFSSPGWSVVFADIVRTSHAPAVALRGPPARVFVRS